MLTSKTESDLYFERLAEEFEAIAGAIRGLRMQDRALAARLEAFAQQIRIDSGLDLASPRRKAG